jgi:sugar/nucleoside kinase (ribokinase family)
MLFDFDVTVFGSGTKDTYMILNQKDHNQSQGICLPYGGKVDATEIRHTTGGGGTNVACALAKFGLKASWWGGVGNDLEGSNVLNDLKEFGAHFKYVVIKDNIPTNQSVVLMYPGSERSIVTYRGASNDYNLQDINFGKLKSKWIYIAPSGGKSLEIFKPILEHASKKQIKTMVNPGSAQLDYIKQNLNILSLIDVFVLNDDEASDISGVNKDDIIGMGKKLLETAKNIVIITKGEKGCEVFDKTNKKHYQAGVIKTEVVDMTGAGDSFCAGFLAGYINKNDLMYAIQLGSAESSHNIANWGAKFNLLSKKDDWEKVEVKVSDLD